MGKFKGRSALAPPDQSITIMAGELDWNDPAGIKHICGLAKGQMVKRVWAEVITTFNGTSPTITVGRYTNGVADVADAFFTSAGLAPGTGGIKDATGGANVTGYTATVDNVSVALLWTPPTGSPTQGRLQVFVEVVNKVLLGVTV